MRSKTPLMLIEQIVMILVFALCAVICLQIFVKSYLISEHNEALAKAVLYAQNTAETLKSGGTDILKDSWDKYEDVFVRFYDESWEETSSEESAEYILAVKEEKTEIKGLGKCSVTVRQPSLEDDVLFSLNVSWQEVDEK